MADREDPVYPGLAASGDFTLEFLPSGGVEVVHSTPGPAGSSVVEFPDGSAWEVDTARPWVLVSLRLPAQVLSVTDVVGAVAGSALVASLFGAEGALFLADRIVAALGESTDAPSEEEPSTWRPGRQGSDPWMLTAEAGPVGALVVAADSAFDTSQPALVRVVAAAAVLERHRRDRSLELLDPLRPELEEILERQAAVVSDAEIDLVNLGVRMRLSKWLGGLPTRSAGGSVAIDSLRRRLGGDLDSGWWLDDRSVAAAVAAPMSAEHPGVFADAHQLDGLWDEVPDPAVAAPIRPTVVEVLGVPAGVEATVEQLDDLLWRFHLDGSAPDLSGAEAYWLRVLRAEDLIPLAFVPLRSTGPTGAVTEFVLPPDHRPGDLRFVFEPQRSRAGRADLVRQAFSLGRAAARLSRLDQSAPEARDAWLSCAEAWSVADDPDRALLASRFAAWPARRPRASRSVELADQVAHDILDSE